MSAEKPTIQEQIAALARLRHYVKVTPRFVNPSASELAVVQAINILDNADLFAALDEAELEREAEGRRRLNERSRQALLHNARHVPADPTHDPR